jgi:hypothetical protein
MKNRVALRQCLVEYMILRLPSPVNASLSIDVMWLLSRFLYDQCDNVMPIR